MSGVRIISIDGGGIKGFLPALVLAVMESSPGSSIGSMADMLAGTSTGAILALGLAAGIPALEMANFYRSKGPAIFRRSWGKRLRSCFGVADEQYSNDGLHTGLREIFGNKKLSDLATPCMAVAYEIETRQAVFFTSWDAKRDPHRDFTLVDAAMASAAAPTYFEPWAAMSVAGDRLACIDGGVAANDPALCAMVEALKAGHPIESIRLVSLGTGREDRAYLLKRARNWGFAAWARPLLDILFAAASDITDHHCRHMLPGRYVRLQQDFSEPVGMDQTDDTAWAVMRMCARKIMERDEFEAALRLLKGEA
ncbi:MAG: CBASS cGAMP-activated phospholipase [Desulfovibrio sp.]